MHTKADNDSHYQNQAYSEPVLQAVVITFREGLEAFLIVGVIVAYLRRVGRDDLVRGVAVGLLAALLLSVGGAYLWIQALNRGDDLNQSLVEGVTALVAAALVGVMLIQVQRMGRHLRVDLERRIEQAAGTAHGRSRGLALAGIAAVTTVFVTREMLEALLVIGMRGFHAHAATLAIGSIIGLLLAATYAFLWSRYGQRLRLHTILKATAIFLAFFLLQLLVWGVHELAESGVIQGSQAFHDATERLGPDGDIGQVFAFAVAAIPLVAAVAGLANMLGGRRTRRPTRASI